MNKLASAEVPIGGQYGASGDSIPLYFGDSGSHLCGIFGADNHAAAGLWRRSLASRNPDHAHLYPTWVYRGGGIDIAPITCAVRLASFEDLAAMQPGNIDSSIYFRGDLTATAASRLRSVDAYRDLGRRDRADTYLDHALLQRSGFRSRGRSWSVCGIADLHAVPSRVCIFAGAKDASAGASRCHRGKAESIGVSDEGLSLSRPVLTTQPLNRPPRIC